MRRFLLGLPLIAMATTAHAQSAWVCTYPGVIQPNSPVIDRYTVHGGELVTEQFEARFKILKNDNYAVIAAWIPPLDDTVRATYKADVFVVLIDKKSRHFRFAHLGAKPGDSSTSEGSCIPDR